MKCATPDCTRVRQRDSLWCPDCLTDRWLLRLPEWRRRALAQTKRDGYRAVKELA